MELEAEARRPLALSAACVDDRVSARLFAITNGSRDHRSRLRRGTLRVLDAPTRLF